MTSIVLQITSSTCRRSEYMPPFWDCPVYCLGIVYAPQSALKCYAIKEKRRKQQQCIIQLKILLESFLATQHYVSTIFYATLYTKL